MPQMEASITSALMLAVIYSCFAIIYWFNRQNMVHCGRRLYKDVNIKKWGSLEGHLGS